MWAVFQAGCFALTGVCLRALLGASLLKGRSAVVSKANQHLRQNTHLHTLREATSRTRISSLMTATSGQKLHLQTGMGKEACSNTSLCLVCLLQPTLSLPLLPLPLQPPPPPTHISSHSCLAVDASANQYVQFWRNTALPWQRSLLSYGEENCKLYSLVSVPPSPLSLVIL